MALYLLCAGLLGGGGLFFPAQELALELLFALLVLVFLWCGGAAETKPRDAAPVYVIVTLVLAIPVLQLIPVPPAVWQSLPGRGDALAALQLVGAGDSWRPVSLVPDKTLACTLALVPPLGLMVLVSQLDLEERRPILYTSVALAGLTTAMGVAQLLAPNGSLTFYSPYYAGWITGFQIGRNGTADVLLIGLIALTAVAKLAVDGKVGQQPSSQPNRPLVGLFASLGVVFAVAVIMTGSRAGMIHLLLPIIAGIVMFSVRSKGALVMRRRMLAFAALGTITLASLIALWFAPATSALGRIGQRFAGLEDNRAEIWDLAMSAWHAYWPVGIGRGGYIAAATPLEALESLGINGPNRAHNEYIEMGIEAGLAAYAVFLAVVTGVVFLAVRKWRAEASREARVQLIFGASVLILFASHSLIDYSLRFLSLACLAGAACGLLTRAPTRKPPLRTRTPSFV